MASAQRPKPPAVQPGIGSILVSPVQRGNGVLNHIKHLAYQFSEIVPDYQVGATTCVLFLSREYHRLHPEYIYGRIEKLHGLFSLLVVCDITEHQDSIRELTKVGVPNLPICPTLLTRLYAVAKCIVHLKKLVASGRPFGGRHGQWICGLGKCS